MGLLSRLERGPQASITGDLWRRFLSSDGDKSTAGVRVNTTNAMRVGAVFGCVRVVSEDVAKLPLILYKRTRQGKERANDHPLYHLLHDKPNEWQTSFEWREMMAAHLELRGNAYSWIVRVGNEIRELIPIHPDHVTVKQDDRYRITYEVQGHSQAYGPGRILHLRGMSSDGYTGLSTLSAAREAVGLAMATERFGSKFFANGARASGALKHKGVLSDEAADRLVKSTEEKLSGENTHKILLLEEDMDWTQISLTAEDSQFLETRKFQVADIARFWRIPLHKIQDLDRSTNNNIEHQGTEYVTDSLHPRLARIEQRLSLALLTESERKEFFYEFLADGLMRGLMKDRAAFYGKAIGDGWMSPNEVRERENMNRVDGLDEYRRPLNTEPVGTPAEEEREDEAA